MIATLAVAEPAQAHPTLLFTTPAADTAEAESPSTVVLVFNEPVTTGASGLVVLDAVGRQIVVDQVATAREGRAVTGPATPVMSDVDGGLGVLPPRVSA